jgi:hypothetical protein
MKPIRKIYKNMITLIIIAVVAVGSFVGGILVGRKHLQAVNAAVTAATTVVADVKSATDAVKTVVK